MGELFANKKLHAVLLFACIGLVCLFLYSRLGEIVEPKKVERQPLITASKHEQWLIFPSAFSGVGMNWPDEMETPVEAPSIGSIPLIQGKVPANYKDGLFDEIVRSSSHRTVGFVNYPGMSTVMCYASYSDTGELQWMVHRSAFGGLASAGVFSGGNPEDGLFLLDLNTGKVIVQFDISDYYQGRDLHPDLGVLELIDGRVVGMAHLKDEKTVKLVGEYVSMKPEIRDCLQK